MEGVRVNRQMTRSGVIYHAYARRMLTRRCSLSVPIPLNTGRQELRRRKKRESAMNSWLRKGAYLKSLELAVEDGNVFREIVYNAEDMIAVTNLDPGATIRFVSPSLERKSGYTLEEFRGFSPYELVDEVGQYFMHDLGSRGTMLLCPIIRSDRPTAQCTSKRLTTLNITHSQNYYCTSAIMSTLCSLIKAFSWTNNAIGSFIA